MRKLYLTILFCFVASTCFGAEFLIKAQRHWSYKDTMTISEQLEYDKQYQIGDIVQVFPDGKLSDYANADGKFYVIRVVGLDFRTALKYQEQYNEEYIDTENKTQTRMLKRRIFSIRIQDLPTTVENKLKTTYVYNTTWTTIKNYIHNKITNTNE